MPNCNFNACYTGAHYPREIFTCNCLNRCSAGNIINPSVPQQWAVFTLTQERDVSNDDAVPVTVSSSSGSSITDGGQGKIVLTAGVYQVGYNILATIPVGGSVVVEFRLDGNSVPSTKSVVSGPQGSMGSASNQIIISLSQSQTLTLVNVSGEAVDFQNANVSLTKIS